MDQVHFCSNIIHVITVFDYGTPLVAKVFSAMGDDYFKTNLAFYRIDSVFLHNQVGFFTEPTWFLFRTDSIALQNRLDSLNRTNSVFLENRLGFFFRTDSIILQNRLGFFTEPIWFFHWTNLVFLVFFFIIKQVAAAAANTVWCTILVWLHSQ